ncbi:hypothetical protein E4T56_gene18260 [Termitomyces sp. T112]|nr:hypothetical protein E4T56_gene18260 [Termitomyces sp. T112]
MSQDLPWPSIGAPPTNDPSAQSPDPTPVEDPWASSRAHHESMQVPPMLHPHRKTGEKTKLTYEEFPAALRLLLWPPPESPVPPTPPTAAPPPLPVLPTASSKPATPAAETIALWLSLWSHSYPSMLHPSPSEPHPAPFGPHPYPP